jgi:hypothetical protein
MRPSGSIIRFIGRRDSDSSPPIREVNGWAASIPESMRIVEPELPASRSRSGARRPSSPLPRTTTSVPFSSTSMPRPRMHDSVEWQSAPVA